MSADLVGLGIAWAKGEGCYIPVSAQMHGKQLPWDDVRAAVQPCSCRPETAEGGAQREI